MSVSVVEKANFGKGFARLDAEYVEQGSLAEEARIRKTFAGSPLAELVAASDAEREQD